MISTIRPVVERGFGLTRGFLRTGERLGRKTVSDVFGAVQRVRHLRPSPKPGMDDVTLARKVETEIFRPAIWPKEAINVNVVNGVVQLRGEVKRPQDIKQIERDVRRVPEVRDVQNLLHTPGSPTMASGGPASAPRVTAKRS
jgi:osmotically-inducible protein OsmY